MFVYSHCIVLYTLIIKEVFTLQKYLQRGKFCGVEIEYKSGFKSLLLGIQNVEIKLVQPTCVYHYNQEIIAW